MASNAAGPIRLQRAPNTELWSLTLKSARISSTRRFQLDLLNIFLRLAPSLAGIILILIVSSDYLFLRAAKTDTNPEMMPNAMTILSNKVRNPLLTPKKTFFCLTRKFLSPTGFVMTFQCRLAGFLCYNPCYGLRPQLWRHPKKRQ